MNLYKLSYFTIWEKFTLVIALFLHRLFGKILIASDLIEYLNFINQLIENGSKVVRENHKEIRIEYSYKKEFSFKCYIRKNSSDIKVFKGVFFNEDYFPIIEATRKKGKGEIATIVDAGANIGLSCLFFSLVYPNAQIIAIEPDNENFRAMEKNIEINGFRNIVPLKAGLWNKMEDLYIDHSFRDGKEWSLSLTRSGKLRNSIPGITFNHILDKFKLQWIDILKMDIEGGERFIFSDEREVKDLLSKISFLAIEIHDEFNIRSDIETYLKDNNFDFFNLRYTTFAIKKFDK